MNPTDLYLSGLVRRYHQQPYLGHFGQTNAAHQWGVAMLVSALCPKPSQQLLVAALTHDVGEYRVGDLAGPFKRQNPEFMRRHEVLETRHRLDILGRINPGCLLNEEDAWLRLCDRLEAVLFVAVHRPQTLQAEDWRNDVATVIKWATELDCVSTVKELIETAISTGGGEVG